MLAVLGLLACWAVDHTAWDLRRERPYYRPLALLFAANILAELTRFALAAHVLNVPGPYAGSVRLAFHVEQAGSLVWHAGVAACFLVVLARLPAWPAAVAWLAAVAVRIVGYSITDPVTGLPWLRGEERLAWPLLVEQVAIIVLGLWAWRRLKRQRPERLVNDEKRELPAPWLQEHHKAVGWILAVEILMLAGPHLVGVANGDGWRITPGNPFKRWALAQIGYTGLFIGLAIQQRRWAWQASKSGA